MDFEDRILLISLFALHFTSDLGGALQNGLDHTILTDRVNAAKGN